jgi:signal transduction histidine kinase
VQDRTQKVADIAVRILQGEGPEQIRMPAVSLGPPKYDWREMQRWGISESRLPPGSTIYFRDPSAWDRYKAQILAVNSAILLQASLIGWLLHERQYRRRAERASREAMSELTQLNRVATAGELSATIAHEVNQPLMGIVTRANAALRWLSGENPNIGKAEDALNHIVAAGHRASDVVASVRAMFGKDTQERDLSM